MSKYKFLMWISLLYLIACSENSVDNPDENLNVISIDTVINYKWGEGQNLGQSSEYFPQNIFGLPSENANENIPESSPMEILSIGLGGSLTVSFKNFYIVDKNGPDFIIFENVFINPITKKNFCEPAKVSVSFDGINFVTFPYDTNNLSGCAGITPTHRSGNNPLDWGGDQFDLSNINLTKIKFIRIDDISGVILNNKNHKYYDATVSGFDLDAIIGINYEKD